MTDGIASADRADPLDALGDALASPPDDLARRSLLLERAAQELRSALAALDSV